VVEHRDQDIEWFGEEGGRGLRGIALAGDTIYLAASNRLLAFDRQFRPMDSWANPHLADCRGLSVYDGKLYLVSSGNDSVLSFDLAEKRFDWAMNVRRDRFRFSPVPYDPASEEGPLRVSKLGLNDIDCGESGMYVSGRDTGGLLLFNGESLQMAVELPAGAQNARRFRTGVLFNDSRDGLVRYSGDDEGSEDRALPVPFYAAGDHDEFDDDATRMLRRGYARGLCALSGHVVAGGMTPASLAVYDLRGNRRLLTVSFTRNVKEAVNFVEVLKAS
jgi:hypothetical protein